MIAAEAERAEERVRLGARVTDFVLLTKPGIVLLLTLTGTCAMVLAARGLPPFGTLVATVVGLALTAGGANAVNMWYDRDIDPLMERTRRRPLPAGRLDAKSALAFGVVAGVAGTALLALLVNVLAAACALLGYVYYVFVYTMGLKRRTPQNIVIGGAAGAFPPLVGWAAVTGRVEWAAVLLFLVIFLWTPPHFWALALYRQEDYRRAGVPMLPVVRGERATKWQILIYSVLLLAVSVLLYATGTVGRVYVAVALALGVGFVLLSVLLLRERWPDVAWAKRTFRYSLLYLTVLFAAMVGNIHR
jgi:protoheme IX farnesyltransferase